MLAVPGFRKNIISSVDETPQWGQPKNKMNIFPQRWKKYNDKRTQYIEGLTVEQTRHKSSSMHWTKSSENIIRRKPTWSFTFDYVSSQFITKYLLHSFCFIFSADAPPVLLYSFIEQTLQPGPAVSLKCSAAGNPTPQISWALDGFPLPTNGRYAFFPIFSSARSHYFVSTETENATICSFSNNHRVHVSSGVIVCETKFICARFECIARNIHRNLCGKRVTVTDEAYKYNGTNFFVVSLAVCCELYRMLYSIIWDMEWRCDCCTVTRC